MKNPEASKKDQDLAGVLASLRYGLYFLCTGAPDAPQGMLVSWVSQVSGDPAMVMAAVRQNRGLLPGLQRRGAFSLNLLAEDQSELLGLLARPRRERFAGVELREGPLGLPVLEQAAAWLCCRVHDVWHPGDHVLMAGEVEGWSRPSDRPIMSANQTGHPYLGLQ